MRRVSILTLFLLLSTLVTMAQRQVTGTVIESETEDAVASTTVKLLKMDSTYVAGCLTDLDGNLDDILLALNT